MFWSVIVESMFRCINHNMVQRHKPSRSGRIQRLLSQSMQVHTGSGEAIILTLHQSFDARELLPVFAVQSDVESPDPGSPKLAVHPLRTVRVDRIFQCLVQDIRFVERTTV